MSCLQRHWFNRPPWVLGMSWFLPSGPGDCDKVGSENDAFWSCCPWHLSLLCKQSSSTSLSKILFFPGTLPLVWLLPVEDRIGKSFLLKELLLWFLITERVSRFLYLGRSCAFYHTFQNCQSLELCQTHSLSSLWSAYCPGCDTYMQLTPWRKPQTFAIYYCCVTFLKCV